MAVEWLPFGVSVGAVNFRPTPAERSFALRESRNVGLSPFHWRHQRCAQLAVKTDGHLLPDSDVFPGDCPQDAGLSPPTTGFHRHLHVFPRVIRDPPLLLAR